MRELSNRELQLQMDVVKVELAKLRLIKDEHNGCLRRLIETMSQYHDRVEKILSRVLEQKKSA